VIVSGTSAPIADAEVAIVTADGVLETTTDAGGRFAMDMCRPADKRFLFERTDFSSNPPLRTRLLRARGSAGNGDGGPTPVAIPSVSMVQGGTD
jgi:hypothetical protein